MTASDGMPNARQMKWLRRGLDQPGGKLPLFDDNGQAVSRRMVEQCLEAGWVRRWFENPLKPDWLVCRLTETGRKLASGEPPRKAKPAAASGRRSVRKATAQP